MSAIDEAYKLINEHSTAGRLFTEVSPFDGDLIINTAFFENGNVRFRFTIKDGRLHGPGKLYYDNGMPMEEMPFYKGLLHGAGRSWYENGQIQAEVNYVNNRLNGPRRHWYPCAQLLSEYSYKDNGPDGPFTIWHRNGQIKERGSYLEGRRHGVFKEFDESGRLLRKDLYVKGVCYTGRLNKLIRSKSLTCRRIMRIRSGAIRRILLEELGYERFAHELGGICLDKDGDQQLLRIDWHKDEEPLVLVKVQCPSTSAFYTLRVPPYMSSVHEAVAWTFGMLKNQYHPQEET
jgi:hypothetical protein